MGCWEENTGDVKQLVILSGDNEGYWTRDLFMDNGVTCLPRAESFSPKLILVGENFSPHQG